MRQEDDSGDEFSDVDEELEASDVDDEALSSDDDDAGEYAAALAELGAARRKAGVDDDDDDDDEDVNEDASDSDDEAFEAVVERTTKKGATVYQVTLCPETAPFTTRSAADEFMRGKAYQKAVKRELRAIRAARKGLREAELTAVWKSKFYGAFVLNHRVVLHAIDATSARWRGDAESSPRNDLVKNCRVHPTHSLISTQVVQVPEAPPAGEAARVFATRRRFLQTK